MVFAAQCVRRIIARGILVFLLFISKQEKLSRAERKEKETFIFHAQSREKFPTEKSLLGKSPSKNLFLTRKFVEVKKYLQVNLIIG